MTLDKIIETIDIDTAPIEFFKIFRTCNDKLYGQFHTHNEAEHIGYRLNYQYKADARIKLYNIDDIAYVNGFHGYMDSVDAFQMRETYDDIVFRCRGRIRVQGLEHGRRVIVADTMIIIGQVYSQIVTRWLDYRNRDKKIKKCQVGVR